MSSVYNFNATIFKSGNCSTILNAFKTKFFYCVFRSIHKCNRFFRSKQQHNNGFDASVEVVFDLRQFVVGWSVVVKNDLKSSQLRDGSTLSLAPVA